MNGIPVSDDNRHLAGFMTATLPSAVAVSITTSSARSARRPTIGETGAVRAVMDILLPTLWGYLDTVDTELSWDRVRQHFGFAMTYDEYGETIGVDGRVRGVVPPNLPDDIHVFNELATKLNKSGSPYIPSEALRLWSGATSVRLDTGNSPLAGTMIVDDSLPRLTDWIRRTMWYLFIGPRGIPLFARARMLLGQDYMRLLPNVGSFCDDVLQYHMEIKRGAAGDEEVRRCAQYMLIYSLYSPYIFPPSCADEGGEAEDESIGRVSLAVLTWWVENNCGTGAAAAPDAHVSTAQTLVDYYAPFGLTACDLSAENSARLLKCEEEVFRQSRRGASRSAATAAMAATMTVTAAAARDVAAAAAAAARDAATAARDAATAAGEQITIQIHTADRAPSSLLIGVHLRTGHRTCLDRPPIRSQVLMTGGGVVVPIPASQDARNGVYYIAALQNIPSDTVLTVAVTGIPKHQIVIQSCHNTIMSSLSFPPHFSHTTILSNIVIDGKRLSDLPILFTQHAQGLWNTIFGTAEEITLNQIDRGVLAIPYFTDQLHNNNINGSPKSLVNSIMNADIAPASTYICINGIWYMYLLRTGQGGSGGNLTTCAGIEEFDHRRAAILVPLFSTNYSTINEGQRFNMGDRSTMQITTIDGTVKDYKDNAADDRWGIQYFRFLGYIQDSNHIETQPKAAFDMDRARYDALIRQGSYKSFTLSITREAGHEPLSKIAIGVRKGTIKYIDAVKNEGDRTDTKLINIGPADDVRYMRSITPESGATYTITVFGESNLENVVVRAYNDLRSVIGGGDHSNTYIQSMQIGHVEVAPLTKTGEGAVEEMQWDWGICPVALDRSHLTAEETVDQTICTDTEDAADDCQQASQDMCVYIDDTPYQYSRQGADMWLHPMPPTDGYKLNTCYFIRTDQLHTKSMRGLLRDREDAEEQAQAEHHAQFAAAAETVKKVKITSPDRRFPVMFLFSVSDNTLTIQRNDDSEELTRNLPLFQYLESDLEKMCGQYDENTCYALGFKAVQSYTIYASGTDTPVSFRVQPIETELPDTMSFNSDMAQFVLPDANSLQIQHAGAWDHVYDLKHHTDKKIHRWFEPIAMERAHKVGVGVGVEVIPVYGDMSQRIPMMSNNTGEMIDLDDGHPYNAWESSNGGVTLLYKLHEFNRGSSGPDHPCNTAHHDAADQAITGYIRHEQVKTLGSEYWGNASWFGVGDSLKLLDGAWAIYTAAAAARGGRRPRRTRRTRRPRRRKSRRRRGGDSALPSSRRPLRTRRARARAPATAAAPCAASKRRRGAAIPHFFPR